MDAREQCQIVSSWIDSGDEADWDELLQAISRLEDRKLVARLRSIAETTTSLTASVARPDESPPRFHPGERLDERYRIECFVDRGGMGEVYRAVDEALDVPIALKVLRPEIASDPLSMQRFKQEVLLARSVSHPNVCRIYHLGHDRTRKAAFLTMELLRGETLAARICASGPMPPETALPIVQQLADGLDAAHRAGIVHRDFKSPNVMLVPDGKSLRVVIMDFGLAIALETEPDSSARPDPTVDAPGRASGAQGVVGTPAYMSPEQVTQGDISTASDLYALGVVLFEMLTGRFPFERRTPLEMALAHVNDTPASPRDFVDLSTTWEETILSLLSKDPAQRPAGASEVMRALQGQPTIRAGHSLPGERDAFVGRRSELEALTRCLENQASQTRLLTVQGPGGMGKTRLVIRYAWESLSRWPGGVHFCDLTDAVSPNGVAHAVAAALDLDLKEEDPLRQLGQTLAGHGRCLLILDNFEQVSEHANSILGPWLQHAPECSFLVTSRERLRIREETVQILAPLEPASYGIELFEKRAQMHNPNFTMDQTVRGSVGQIVERLEGIPLAIELAASRTRLMSVEQLDQRLDNRLRILSGGTRGRHATLTAALDWSWELLEPSERSTLVQATVFEGGCNLDAMETVVELPDAAPKTVLLLDIVQSLLDKSWLQTASASGDVRFKMFETIKDYLETQSSASGLDEARVRHGEYYAQLGKGDSMSLVGRPGGAKKGAVLQAEIGNLVVACRRGIERQDEVTAAQCYFAADQAFALRGPYEASVRLGSDLFEALSDPSLRASVSTRLGRALKAWGKFKEADRYYQAALEVYLQQDDRGRQGTVYGYLGSLHLHMGMLEKAQEELETGLAIHRELGDRASEASGLGNLGIVHRYAGRPDEARVCYEAALRVHRELGDELSEGLTLGLLGGLCHDLGQLDDSEKYLRSALTLSQNVGDRSREGSDLAALGNLLQARGRPEDALEHFERSLSILQEVGDRQFEGAVLGLIGLVHKDMDRLEDARAHCEMALSISREVGDKMSEGYWLGNLGDLGLDEKRFEDAIEYANQALSIVQKGGNRVFEGAMTSLLGRLHQATCEMDMAQGHHERALELLRATGDRHSLAAAVEALGHWHIDNDQMVDAASCFREAQDLHEGMGESANFVGVLCAQVEVHIRTMDMKAARAALDQAEGVLSRLGASPHSKVARRVSSLRSALEGGRRESST